MAKRKRKLEKIKEYQVVASYTVTGRCNITAHSVEEAKDQIMDEFVFPNWMDPSDYDIKITPIDDLDNE